MRNVGPLTQAAIEADTYQRAVRVSVYDEAGVEIPIPGDLIVGFPRPESSLDDVAWRMSLSVLVTPETEGKLLRGRTIKAWDVFAVGEDLELFTGYIADAKPATDWSSGVERAAWNLECVGDLSRRFEALLTWYYWEPAPMNPDALNPYAPGSGDRIKLTGLVKTYRITMVNSGITPVSTVTNAPDSVTLDLVSASGFAVNDQVYVLMGKGAGVPRDATYSAPRMYRRSIGSVSGNRIVLAAGPSDTKWYPYAGTVVTKKVFGIPLTSSPFWPDRVYYRWIKVYNSSGVEMTSGWDAGLIANVGTEPVIAIAFTTNPGPTFTVEAMAVDRWVILRDRYWHNGSTRAKVVPSYQIMSGIAGSPASEQINDPGRTQLRGDKTHTATVIYVERPDGLFAGDNPFPSYSLPSDVSSTRWATVYHNGREYRGSVTSVDKNPASPDYGKVTFDSWVPLRDLSTGTAMPAIGLGSNAEAINSTARYYEALSHTAFPETYATSTDTNSDYRLAMRHEPYGGFFLKNSLNGWAIDPIIGSEFKPHLYSTPIVIDYADRQPANDVAQFFRQILMDTGMSSSDLSIADTAYTLAPFNQAQKTIGELVEEVRKSTIPPNFRLWEDENGKVVGKYIAQATEPELILRGVRKFSPVEKPRPVTRVIVRGKQHEINRAGQLIARNSFTSPWYLFDGVKSDYQKASSIRGVDASKSPDGRNFMAEAWFQIPKCEPGRYPLVTKVSVGFWQLCDVQVGGASSIGGPVRWLPRSHAQVQNSDAWVRSMYSKGIEAIALGSGNVSGAWALLLKGDTMGEIWDYVDEIEVFVKEGAYWESTLTSLASEVPGDPAAGGSSPGLRWIQPDPTLAISNRYVPPDWLARAQAIASKDLDRTIVIENDGISQEQAREIAEATLDDQLRGSEFYECEATYDPRIEKGMAVGVPQGDGSVKPLLVWSILKEEKTMKLKLADYSI